MYYAGEAAFGFLQATWKNVVQKRGRVCIENFWVEKFTRTTQLSRQLGIYTS